MSEAVRNPAEFFEALEHFGGEPTQANYRDFTGSDTALYWTLSNHPDYQIVVNPERTESHQAPPDEVDAALGLIAEQTQDYVKNLLLAEWIIDSQLHSEHLTKRWDRIELARRNLIEVWKKLGGEGEKHAARNEEKLRNPFSD